MRMGSRWVVISLLFPPVLSNSCAVSVFERMFLGVLTGEEYIAILLVRKILNLIDSDAAR